MSIVWNFKAYFCRENSEQLSRDKTHSKEIKKLLSVCTRSSLLFFCLYFSVEWLESIGFAVVDWNGVTIWNDWNAEEGVCTSESYTPGT